MNFNMKRRILGGMLLLAVVIQLTLLAPSVLAQDEDFHVQGIVESAADGTALSGVLISVYATPGGSLVKMSSTDVNGYISLRDIPAGSYNLVFEKQGYETYTTSISSTDETINLGFVRMSNALQLSSTASSRVTSSGKTLVLPFMLSNAGAEEEEIVFTIASPEGWDMKITDTNSELLMLQLPAGDTTSLNLEIEVPLDAMSEYNIQVTISGSKTLEWPLTIIVEEEDTQLLGSDFPSKSGRLGSIIEFPVTIQNPFDVRTAFRLEMLNVPEAWEVAIRDIDRELVNAVLLGPNQSINVIVEAEIPENANEGAYAFTVAVTAPYIADTMRLEVLVIESFAEAKIQAKYPSQSVPLDSTVEYEITIENPSQTDELFSLSAPEIPVGWELVFKAVKEDEQTQEIGAVLIEALEAENIIVEITPSLNSDLGEYLIPIEAISSGARGSITLKTIVSGSYDARVRVDSLFMEIQAATTETVTVTVTNTGFSPLTNVELLVTSAPNDWTVETSPLKHATLNPNEAVEFQVSIQVPAEAARGDYLVEFQPSIDQIAMEALEPPEIRVTVNPETAWGIYGLALVMAAFAVVFLIMMKFRRR